MVLNKEDMNIGLSIYLKLFLNYLQMVSIIQSLELNWPFYVRNYLNLYSNIGGVSTQIISFDCLLQNYKIKIEPVYIQTLLTLFLPFGIFFITLAILLLLFIVKRRSQLIRFIVTIVVVSIFLQPPIIKALFDNLICKQIENNQVLQIDMTIDCNSDGHYKWVFIRKNYKNIFYLLFRQELLFTHLWLIGS